MKREYTTERRSLTFPLPLRQWVRSGQYQDEKGKTVWLWSSREWSAEAKAEAQRQHTCLVRAK